MYITISSSLSLCLCVCVLFCPLIPPTTGGCMCLAIIFIELIEMHLKFSDTILKKYSSTVATIFTGIASAVMFGHTLTVNFLLGISIVFISMHQVI